MEARHLLISGIVQGVGYRAWTVRTARAFGLNGWVRNLHDGRVEVWAEGSAEDLAKLEASCHQGPRYAEVEKVVARSCPPKGHPNFDAAPTVDLPEI